MVAAAAAHPPPLSTVARPAALQVALPRRGGMASMRLGPWERLVHSLRGQIRAIQAVDDAMLSKCARGGGSTAARAAAADVLLPMLGCCCCLSSWCHDTQTSSLWTSSQPGCRRRALSAAGALRARLAANRRRPPLTAPATRPPRRSFPASSRYLLAPALRVASSAYSLYHATRHFLYRQGLLRSLGLPCPVISIGNMTNGGTGG